MHDAFFTTCSGNSTHSITISCVVLIKVKSENWHLKKKISGQISQIVLAHCRYFNNPEMEISLTFICTDTGAALSHSWGKAPHMHLFGLLFHFSFYHKSPLKCLFDWNRPCCSHTLLQPLSILQLPPACSPFFFLFLCSRAGALFGITPSLLSYRLPAFFFPSFNIKWRNPPSLHTHLVSLLVFVCFMLAPDGESWGGFLCWEIQDSLPALILDNRKMTDCSLVSYWQHCVQRCLQMRGHNSVWWLEEEMNQQTFTFTLFFVCFVFFWFTV